MIRERELPLSLEEVDDSDSWESDFSYESDDELPHFQQEFEAAMVASEGDVSAEQELEAALMTCVACVPQAQASDSDDESSDEDYLHLHEEEEEEEEEEPITEPCPLVVKLRQDLPRYKELCRMRQLRILERIRKRCKE